MKLRRVESSRISDAPDDTGLVSRFCFVLTPHSALIAPFPRFSISPFPLVPCQLPAACCCLSVSPCLLVSAICQLPAATCQLPASSPSPRFSVSLCPLPAACC